MTLPDEGKLLRIFIGESDRHENMPLFEWIVRKAREQGIAGATVVRGLEGYGARSLLHTSKILRLSSDLPVIIEIVDTGQGISAEVRDKIFQPNFSTMGSCGRGDF